MKRDLICIACPLGCHLEVTIDEGKIEKVTGHTCKRGEEYAVKECTNPTRIITSSIEVMDGTEAVVSVKTQNDIPKDKIFDIVKSLKNVKVTAPVKIGDIIVEDVLGTGVNIVATKSIPHS